MAKPLVPDALWEIVEPLLPPHADRPRGGHKRVDDRACFAGILFVLKTGIAWEDLPAEMGCGCGMTCWRRLRDWHGPACSSGCTKCCWPSRGRASSKITAARSSGMKTKERDLSVTLPAWSVAFKVSWFGPGEGW